MEAKDKEKKTRASSEELDKFVMPGSSVDNNLTSFDITDDTPQPVETGMGVMTEMISQAIDGQMALIPVKTRGAKGKTGKSVFTYVSLSYDNDPSSDVSLSIRETYKNKLSPYDKRALNAAFTLMLAGKTSFSVSEVISVASGYANRHPNDRQINTMLRSLRKSSRILINLDISDELAANNFQDRQALVDAGVLKDLDDNIKSAKFEGRLLSVEFVDIESEKGLRSVTVKVLGEPLLLSYNRAKRSLMSVPMEYLRLQAKNMSMSDRSIAIQDYLLKRVVGYQKGYFNSNKILYNTILEAINSDSIVEETENQLDDKKLRAKIRQQKTRDKAFIHNIFDSWVKNGLIDSYKEIVTPNNIYKGIEFIAHKKLSNSVDRPKYIQADEDK